jgi:hypothetical protein
LFGFFFIKKKERKIYIVYIRQKDLFLLDLKMSIASPTTTMNNNSSPSSNPLTSLLHSITKKRSISPVVQRFVDLCINQNKQNDLTLPSSNLNEHTEKMIRNLVKKLIKLKKNGSIDELEKAILHKDSRTKCVTIPR